MPSFKTIQVVNPKYPQKYSIINEKDFDPKKHTPWGAPLESFAIPVTEVADAVHLGITTEEVIGAIKILEKPKNKGGRPKGSQNKKKTKKAKKKAQKEQNGDSKDQEVKRLRQDTPQ